MNSTKNNRDRYRLRHVASADILHCIEIKPREMLRTVQGIRGNRFARRRNVLAGRLTADFRNAMIFRILAVLSPIATEMAAPGTH